jgi:uncharacterized protein
MIAIKTLEEVLSARDEILLAVLYGSAAAGTATETSDIDLAVAYEKPMSLEQKITLAGQLSLALEREIDLTDLHQAEGIFLTQILSKGKVIINRNEPLLARFIQKMVYFQADFYPYIKRMMAERRRRWIGI